MNETITTIVGNVVDAPNRRRLESGVSVASFRVASSARRFDRVTNHWVDGESLYLKVTCWRSLADNVAQSLVKGDPIVVTGKLYSRLYEVGDVRRAAYELEASAVGFDLNRGVGTFKRLSKRAATIDDVGADGIPSGSAIDAYLDAARADEDDAERAGFGGSEEFGGADAFGDREAFGGPDGSEVPESLGGQESFGDSGAFGGGDEFGGPDRASLGRAAYGDDPFAAEATPPEPASSAAGSADVGPAGVATSGAPAKRSSSGRRRGAGAALT